MNIGREQRQQITYNSGEQQKRMAETGEELITMYKHDTK